MTAGDLAPELRRVAAWSLAADPQGRDRDYAGTAATRAFWERRSFTQVSRRFLSAVLNRLPLSRLGTNWEPPALVSAL